jgi:uncharacterized protein DUF3617
MKFLFAAAAALLLGQPTAPPPLAPADLLRVMRLEPGRWQTISQMLDVEIIPAAPGVPVPAGSGEAARSPLGLPRTDESCIGTGLAADGALILPGISIAAAGCSYSALEAANGRLRLVGRCGRAETRLTEVRIDASYVPTGMAGTIVTTSTPAGGGSVVRMRSIFDSTHVGVCR